MKLTPRELPLGFTPIGLDLEKPISGEMCCHLNIVDQIAEKRLVDRFHGPRRIAREQEVHEAITKESADRLMEMGLITTQHAWRQHCGKTRSMGFGYRLTKKGFRRLEQYAELSGGA
jgi:hypothetical protein